MKLNVYVCFVLITLFCFWTSFGTSEKININLLKKDRVYFFDEDKSIYNFTNNCYPSIQEEGKTKWFQIKGKLHEYQIQPNKMLTSKDHNTIIYCIFLPWNWNTSCEIFSYYNITFKSRINTRLTSVDDNFRKTEVNIEYIKSPNGKVNKFDIKCTAENMPQPDETILEVYEIKDNLNARLLNKSKIKGNSITMPITICNNASYIYCRAVINDSTENFYKSDIKLIKPFDSKVMCSEIISCNIDLQIDTETTSFTLTHDDTPATEPATIFITNELSVSGDNEATNSTSINGAIIVVSTSSICIILVILVIVFCVRKRKHRRKKDYEYEPKVMYAELQVHEQGTHTFCKTQETHYAKIVGVIKHANKDITQAKTNVTVAEEITYATPYINNYAQSSIR